MSRVVTATATLLGGAGAVLVCRWRLRATPSATAQESHARWHTVTINRAPEEVMPGSRRPGPLAELGERVEVEVRRAPGGKGAELRARLTSGGKIGSTSRLSGTDPRQDVRSALRRSKQLIEVGEVLQVAPRPHGRRTATLRGKLVDTLARRAGGEGLV